MADKTPNLGLPLITENMTANVPRDMNALAQAIDESVGDISIPDASLTVKGKVQLSNKIDGDSEERAPTEKALNDARLSIISDYIRQPGYAITMGTATAYVATLNPAPATIPEGFGITIVPHLLNGANPTLNVNGRGAIPLKRQDGSTFNAGDLLVGKPYTFRRIGTDFLADSSGELEINGQKLVQVEYGGAINKHDPIVMPLSFERLDIRDANTNVTALAISPDGRHIVFAEQNGNIIVYQYSEASSIYVKLSTEYYPGQYIESLVWSDDGIHVYAGARTNSTRTFWNFKLGATGLSKLPDPSIMPGGTSSMSIRTAKDIVVVGINESPYAVLYRRVGDTLVKIPGPTTTAPNSAMYQAVGLSNDAKYLVFGAQAFFYVYNESSQTYEKMPGNTATRTITAFLFTKDGHVIFLIYGSTGTAGLEIWEGINNGYFRPVTFLGLAPQSGSGSNRLVMTDDGVVLVASQSYNEVYVYLQKGKAVYHIGFLPDVGNEIKLSLDAKSDGSLIVLGSVRPAPSLRRYNISKKIYKADKANIFSPNLLAGYAKESGVTGDKKTVVSLFN